MRNYLFDLPSDLLVLIASKNVEDREEEYSFKFFLSEINADDDVEVDMRDLKEARNFLEFCQHEQDGERNVRLESEFVEAWLNVSYDW